MTVVYLNGDYLPMAEAKISPMDRGFLFGDGIYEVIPSYQGRLVGFDLHMQRMQKGLAAISIDTGFSAEQWREVLQQLLQCNDAGNLGIYVHVSRGADNKRYHAYPKDIPPTLFAFTFEIPPASVPDKQQARALKVTSSEDLRWKRCHIKSTSLLGNVMHFQQGQDAGVQETILYNQQHQLTEASACNVFIVKNQTIITPPLDNQLLPGITRHMLLDILRKDGSLPVQERSVDMQEVHEADEVWLTSSSKEIAPVVEIDKQAVGDGSIGDIWLFAQTLYSQNKYDY